MNAIMLNVIVPLLEDLGVAILKRGRIPKHVAFVADGARRFGKKHKIPVCENHEIGLHACMLEVIDWCLLLGIPEYSILMFSFGNYHRPKEETQHWIDVLKVWLLKCIKNWSVLEAKGIRFNFYGKFGWIPAEINALMGILMLLTKDNDKVTVNMAMGYTSKHEMSTVAFNLYAAIRDGKIGNNLSVECFNECLFAIENHDVDLFIRTSGYKRISNFLCWQSSNSLIYFCDCLWPEFSKSDFLKAIFYYQRGKILTERKKVLKFDDDQLLYFKELRHKSRHSLMKYCFEMKYVRHDVDVEKLYSSDYESIYHHFELACDSVFWYE